MGKVDVKQEISRMQPTTKAAQLRNLMPEIELKLAAGVQLKDVQEALKNGGLDFTIKTLKTYIYRFRKESVKTNSVAKKPQVETPIVETTNTENTVEDSSNGPVSMQHLASLMKPDPEKEAADIANYERIAKQQRKAKK